MGDKGFYSASYRYVLIIRCNIEMINAVFYRIAISNCKKCISKTLNQVTNQNADDRAITIYTFTNFTLLNHSYNIFI